MINKHVTYEYIIIHNTELRNYLFAVIRLWNDVCEVIVEID